MELTPEQLARYDPAYWVLLNNIKLQSCTFSFDGHEYQSKPMTSKARRICYMKGTQGGFSELEILRSLHGMITNSLPQGVLYLFPTDQDMEDYSKARFGPLVDSNPAAIGKFVKNAGSKTDTARLKRVGKAMLYLRGARTNSKMQDGLAEKDTSKTSGISVDKVVFDEFRFMDPLVIAKALGRMGASDVKQEAYITNPGIPGDFADKQFELSDQQHWFRRCPCGNWFSADEEFPDCVAVKADGHGYIKCRKCGRPVPFWAGDGTGAWVAKVPSNTSYMEGYHWSHLTSKHNDPADVLRDYLNPPQGNLSDVVRTQLGRSHVASTDKLTPMTVRECMTRDPMPMAHAGPCAMGVDIGKTFHAVIGCRIGQEAYRIVKVMRVANGDDLKENWNDLYDIARRYNVKSAVVDLLPYEDSARDWCKRATNMRAFACQYTQNAGTIPNWESETKIISVHRTGIFDATHKLFSEKHAEIPRDNDEMKVFVDQVCAPAKVLRHNNRSNSDVYDYIGDNDHYRNALNYFLLAAREGRIANVNRKANEQKTAIHSYQMI